MNPEPLIVERTFNAPVAALWKAISDKQAVKRWAFDFEGYELRTGCEFYFSATDKGITYIHRCVVKEVIPNKKLAYSWGYEGYEGDSLVTFELFAEGDKTRLKLTHAGLETLPKLPAFARANFEMGWNSLIHTCLKDYIEPTENHMNGPVYSAELVGDREIVQMHIFDAPRELVFEAWIDPNQVTQWWGPTGFTTTTHNMDVKPGGQWRFCMHGPDGRDYENLITYREIVKPERIVYKHGGEKDDEPVNFVTTVTFEDIDGKTRLTMRAMFPSAAARDYVIKTYGALEGGTQHLARLGEFLAKKR